jgi:hypothetical protein
VEMAGFEPATPWLQTKCSTPELHPRGAKTRVNPPNGAQSLAESLKVRDPGADTLSRMSDRAKARLVAAGLSLVLSAQVAVIIVGALVLATRLGAFGPTSGALGAITLSQPAGVIITGNVGEPDGTPNTEGPPTDASGDDAPNPPPGPCADCAPPDEPVAGVTISGDFPIIGSFELPLRIGSSSGNNIHRTVRVRNVALMVSLSRRPLRDLLPFAKKPVHARHPQFVFTWRSGNGNGKPGHGHGPPLKALLHQLLK